VTLVDVKSDPIASITPTGIRLVSGRDIAVDVIILATGFDSGTGALTKIDIEGRGGITLSGKWAAGPVTYLGLMTHDFPNLFMVAGPGSPSIRSQVMVSIEQHVEWLADLLREASAESIVEIEPTVVAEEGWTDHVSQMVATTLLAHDDTQYFGSNVPGKPRVYLAYVGGVGYYRAICDAVKESDYEGFTRVTADGRRLVSAEAWSGPPKNSPVPTRFGNTVI
jgi:hypothetical protein